MQELITNDRVIGGMTPACSQAAARLYRTFVIGDCVVASGPRVAEMAKLTENSFRDVNIAFANELSLICDALGMDVRALFGILAAFVTLGIEMVIIRAPRASRLLLRLVLMQAIFLSLPLGFLVHKLG